MVRELTRGYTAGVLAGLTEAAGLTRLQVEIDVVRDALARDRRLSGALTDAGIAPAIRRALVADLLARGSAPTLRLVTHAVRAERAPELPAVLSWTAERLAAEARARASEGGPVAVGEPGVGRMGARERLSGFADALFEEISDRSRIEEVEDDLFRFARTTEASEQLRAVLVNPALPLSLRQAVVRDLLAPQAQPTTVTLVAYLVAEAQGRGVVNLLDWLATRAAAELGLRIAQVSSARALDDDEQHRLAEALGRMTGRAVEVRMTVDEDLVGGLQVLVGDTVIDGSVRGRLANLREELTALPITLSAGGSTPGGPADPVDGGAT